MYTMLSFVNQVSTWHRYNNTSQIKEPTQDTLDDSTRILHQATTSCQSSPCSPLDNRSYLRGVVEGPGRSISVKKTTKQWVKHSESKYNIRKA